MSHCDFCSKGAFTLTKTNGKTKCFWRHSIWKSDWNTSLQCPGTTSLQCTWIYFTPVSGYSSLFSFWKSPLSSVWVLTPLQCLGSHFSSVLGDSTLSSVWVLNFSPLSVSGYSPPSSDWVLTSPQCLGIHLFPVSGYSPLSSVWELTSPLMGYTPLSSVCTYLSPVSGYWYLSLPVRAVPVVTDTGCKQHSAPPSPTAPHMENLKRVASHSNGFQSVQS